MRLEPVKPYVYTTPKGVEEEIISYGVCAHCRLGVMISKATCGQVLADLDASFGTFYHAECVQAQEDDVQ